MNCPEPGFSWGSTRVGDCAVAYRSRSGNADLPLLAVFHQSPLSGWTFEPLFDHLRYDGHVVVLDTPGYGQSARLDGAQHMDDFAEILWAAVDSLRADRPVVLLGQHTGARLALTIAVRHPEHIRRVVFQGLSLYTDEERRERSASWALPIPLEEDGNHLFGFWERISRLYPDASLEIKNRSVRDYLAADPDYAHAYRAVFAQDSETLSAGFSELGIPSHVLAGDRDLLFDTQHRVVDRFGSELVALDGLTDFAVWEDPQRFCDHLDRILAHEVLRR